MYKIKIICSIFSASTQGLYSIHGAHLETQTGSTVHLHTHVWFKSTHPAHLSNVDWGATGGHENSQPSLHCQSAMSLPGQPVECEETQITNFDDIIDQFASATLRKTSILTLTFQISFLNLVK